MSVSASTFDNPRMNGLPFLGNLSVVGEESDDEGRQDEIKELLAHAFSGESFAEEGDGENIVEECEVFKDGKEPFATFLRRRVPGFETGRSDAEGERDTDEVTPTVSMTHGSHCPEKVKTGENDNGVQYDTLFSNPEETIEELKTLCEFRERQVQRSEDTIGVLSKDKRALSHQLALLRTEIIGMKASDDELQKTIKVKDEEIEFLQEKVQEVLVEYEGAKKSEIEAKDETVRLNSQIGKMTQEIKLLSAIGHSTMQSELNDVVRQIREKHATEINYWKTKVSELEADLCSFKKINGGGSKTDEGMQTDMYSWISEGTQTVFAMNSHPIAQETQTSVEMVELNDVNAALRRQEDVYTEEIELWKGGVLAMEEKLRSLEQKAISLIEISCQTEDSLEECFLRAARENSSVGSCATETQTVETLETYKVLGRLIETWAGEVTESNERTKRAEKEVGIITNALKHLKRKYFHLQKYVSLWKRHTEKRENIIVRQKIEAEQRYAATLMVILKNFDKVDKTLDKV